MMKKLSTILAVILSLLFVLAACAPAAAPSAPADTAQQPEAAQGFKVGLLVSGPTNDSGWNAVAYQGLQAAIADLGVSGDCVENVSAQAQEEVLRNFANQGYDMIIAHGYEFNDAVTKVAKDFPNIKFVVTSSSVAVEPNLAALEVSNKEAGFIGGVLAGAFTETNKIAYIGGEEMPPITDAADGFVAGSRLVNEAVEPQDTLIGSWDDVAKAKEVAISYIENGCDVVLGNANQAGLGVIEGAKEKGKTAIGFAGDQAEVAPETVVASSKYDLSVGIKFVINEALQGTFEAKYYLLATKEGATGVLWNEALKPSLDPAKVQLVEDTIQAIVNGEIDVEALIAAVQR
ncbi:MAG: BMP family protein [Christensenellaceae bacterium]|nr:BMP family protein [Christensenellaceae bacterium]